MLSTSPVSQKVAMYLQALLSSYYVLCYDFDLQNKWLIDCDTTDYEDNKEVPICSKGSYFNSASSSEWKARKYLLNMLKALNPPVPGDKLAGKFFAKIW